MEGGTITGSGNYVSGSTVQLIATAREHYRFVGWEEQGELISEETEVELEINEPRTLVARFAPVEQVQEVTLPPAGHVVTFYPHTGKPGVLYAATEEVLVGDGNAGTWLSEDGGATWTKTHESVARYFAAGLLDPDLIVAGIADDVILPDIAYEVWISTDGGHTWVQRNVKDRFGDDLETYTAMPISNDRGIFITVGSWVSGLYWSGNLGEEWQHIFTPADAGEPILLIRDLAVVGPDFDTIYAVSGYTPSNIWKSVDGGRSFISIQAGLPVQDDSFSVAGMRTDVVNPDLILIRNAASVNGGSSWALREDLLPRSVFWLNGKLMRIASNHVEMSEDAGATWVTVIPIKGSTSGSNVQLAPDAFYFGGLGSEAHIYRLSRASVEEAMQH